MIKGLGGFPPKSWRTSPLKILRELHRVGDAIPRIKPVLNLIGDTEQALT